MIAEKNIPVYCINLKRATERRERMLEEWTKKRGVDLIFFDAVDQKDLDINNLPEPFKSYTDFFAKKYKNIPIGYKHQGKLKLGEIACSISHSKVLGEILKSGATQAVVLEDDAEPLFDTAEEFFDSLSSYKLDQQKASIILLHDQLKESYYNKCITDKDIHRQKNHHILYKSVLCTQSIFYKNKVAIDLAKAAFSIILSQADWAWNYLGIVENKMLGISTKPLTAHTTGVTYINYDGQRAFVDNTYNENSLVPDVVGRINSLINTQSSQTQFVQVPFYSNRDNALEKYFQDFYKKNISEFNETGYTFLSINWTDLYGHIAKGNGKIQRVLNQLGDFLPQNRKYFTVSQHDDSPKEKLPPETVNFSAGGNINNTIPIPLICGDDLTSHCLEETCKDIFGSFVGSITHPIRNIMFETLSDKGDYKFTIKDKWTAEISQNEQNAFIDITKRSKFTLCPRGYGATSWRLYEAMQLGSVPVYIYDKLHLPYQSEINWNDICVLVHVNDIKNIDDILKSISDEKYNAMVSNIKNIYPVFFNLDYMCRYILDTLKNSVPHVTSQ